MYLLYFLPEASRMDDAALREAGLGYLAAVDLQQRSYMAKGPDDKAGLLVADKRLAAGDLYYEPDKQRWRKSLNGKFWLGYFLDSPPTEAELAAANPIDGHRVELMEGQKFLIPVARCFPTGTKFPRPLILTAAGLQYGPVNLPYRDFSTKAESLWQYFAAIKGWIDKEEQSIEMVDLWKMTAEAIGFNYKIGPDEINLLGMLTSDNIYEAALAIIDGPTIRQWETKTAEELKKKAGMV